MLLVNIECSYYDIVKYYWCVNACTVLVDSMSTVMNMHDVLPSSQKIVRLVQQMLDDRLATSPSSVKPVYSCNRKVNTLAIIIIMFKMCCIHLQWT